MRYLLVALLCLSAFSAQAFDTTTNVVVRTVYVTGQISSSPFENKRVVMGRDDAAVFVASEGEVRTAQLQAALESLREQWAPAVDMSDLQLAGAILAQ